MTRIGFAYNQKPEPASPEAAAEQATIRSEEGDISRPDEEPPSIAGSSHAADFFAEWDSIETIDAVAAALGDLGEVIRLEANEDFPELLRATRPDIVFNIAEGLNGVNRESHVPAICEFYGIPYSGSDPFTLSLCLDKARAKEVLSFHGVPTARFSVIERMDDIADVVERMSLPLFLKPLHEGSSKGITEKSFCRTREELDSQAAFLLETYEQPVLAEEYLPGAEFTCAVLGNGSEARVLPIVGINFGSLPDGAIPIYGYEAKWIWDRPENPLDMFSCPAPIDESLRQSIEELTLKAYSVLGCRDWSRIDVRLDAAGTPNVVEVNPLPGILPNPDDNSCLPKAARAAGIEYDELIRSCLQHAAMRQGVPLAARLKVVRGDRSSRPEALERLSTRIGARLKA